MTAISFSRRRAIRDGSVTPNTARQMTSNVSARMRSRSTSSLPGCQRAISRSATSRITSRKAATREPWNGGSSSLRWRRCSGPSRTSTEWGPRAGSMNEFASPARMSD